MCQMNIRDLDVLVAGEPGNGKTNFIKRFLENFPPSAEVRKRHATMYCVYLPDQGLKIQLHDFHSVENMDSSVYDKMHIILFYSAANDGESVLNIEKWISLMGVNAKKEVLSILLADWGNLGRQRDAPEMLAQQVNVPKDAFDFKLAIQSSSEDDESASKVLQIIKSVLPPAKMYKACLYREEWREKRVVLRKDVLKQLNELSSLSSSNCGERNNTLEEIQNLKFSFQELWV